MSCRMPFGKYRGLLVEDLPDLYVEWLFELEDLREPLRSAVDRKGLRRFRQDAEPVDFPDEPAVLFGELIEAGFRALAPRYHHPDDGGSTEAMQRLNGLMARLRRGLLAV